jgi:hypothetical protein
VLGRSIIPHHYTRIELTWIIGMHALPMCLLTMPVVSTGQFRRRSCTQALADSRITAVTATGLTDPGSFATAVQVQLLPLFLFSFSGPYSFVFIRERTGREECLLVNPVLHWPLRLGRACSFLGRQDCPASSSKCRGNMIGTDCFQ